MNPFTLNFEYFLEQLRRRDGNWDFFLKEHYPLIYKKIRSRKFQVIAGGKE